LNIAEFKVERWLNTYESMAKYEMAETDIKPFTLRELLELGDFEELKDELFNMRLGYNNPTKGSDRLRELVATLYGNGTTANNVLMTTGAIEADFLVANVLVSPGDSVVVQFPAYQALYSTAEARGANVKYWKMKFEDGFEPKIEELENLIDERTKLVVLNIPNNPTGAVISEEQLRTVLKWAEEGDFYVLCDEVYHDLKLRDGVVPPYGRSLSERAISVGSMSKAYGLSGVRIGWVVAPEELIEKMWSWKDYTSISNSPLSDFLATVALSNREKVLTRSMEIALRNLNILIDWFEENSRFFDYVVPKAGVLCFPRVKNIPVSTEELCRGVFEDRRLLLVPGEAFDMSGHLRIGFGGDTEKFKMALGILSEYVRENWGR